MPAAPDGHFQINHGKLLVNVPRNIFRGIEATIDEEKAEPFRKMLMERYPWLSRNSLDELLKKARLEYIRIRDEETGGRDKAKNFVSKGRDEEAIKHLRRHLEQNPQDADTWYALGEILCRLGRTEEGYEAFNRGRKLF